MNEYKVLQLFISEIESVVSVPVRMSNHDDKHEGDMVLIDNLNTERRLRSTNPYVGPEKENGNIIGEKLQYYFDARLDVIVQSESEDVAYQTRQKIQDHFRLYERNPTDLANEIVLFELGDGGERTAQFEPTVFRLFKQTQSFHFSFTDESVVESDTISVIEDNL